MITTARDYLDSIAASVKWLQNHHTYIGTHKQTLQDIDKQMDVIIQAIYDAGYQDDEE